MITEDKEQEAVNSFAQQQADLCPWQGAELQKVCLNKYINLGYISEDKLKLVIERIHNFQVSRQEEFKKIIKEMQRDESENKSHEYSSRIIDNQDRYNVSILFLDFSRYLKSLLYLPTRRVLQVADLVYPQGVLMQWAFRTLSAKMNGYGKAKFLTKFDFTVNLLSLLDEYHCSVFLVGGVASLLNHVEEIFETSFSNIKVLGRYAVCHRKEWRMSDVRTVINKSTPTLLLVARNAKIHNFVDGKNGKRKTKSFLVLDYPEALSDFSGKYRHKKNNLLSILLSLGYLIFPWKWPKLICIPIFLIKIFFLSIATSKKSR